MLKVLRKNTKLIIWTVIVAFVLWGGYSVGTQFQKQGRIAGEVFGKEVTFQEFDRHYRAAQIFSYSGQTLQDPEQIKRQAWQNIIFAREAKQQKIKVSDNEVREEILRLLKLQKIENATPEVYRQWLKGALREDPRDFETKLRDLLLIQKLIAKMNEAPLMNPPTAEEALDNFRRENHSLSLEFIKFKTIDEVKAFRDKIKKIGDWKKELKARPNDFKTTGMIALDAVINLWQIPSESAFHLHQMKKDEISGAEPIAGEFAVFRILDKQAGDEEKFEKEKKTEILDRLTQQRKFERFIAGSSELTQKANLKDFLPQSEALPPPPAEPEPPAPNAEVNENKEN